MFPVAYKIFDYNGGNYNILYKCGWYSHDYYIKRGHEFFSWGSGYNFISTNNEIIEYNFIIYACCPKLKAEMNKDILDMEELYNNPNYKFISKNAGRIHCDNCYNKIHVGVYLKYNNKSNLNLIYDIKIDDLLDTEFIVEECGGHANVNAFISTIKLYNNKKYESYNNPYFKLKIILDYTFVMYPDKIYIIRGILNYNFIYHDELYFSKDDIYYVFSQGYIYKLSNNIRANADLFSKHFNHSYICVDKNKSVLLYRDYYKILYSFTLLITYTVNSITVENTIKKIKLPHELWNFIHFEYFENMNALK